MGKNAFQRTPGNSAPGCPEARWRVRRAEKTYAPAPLRIHIASLAFWPPIGETRRTVQKKLQARKNATFNAAGFLVLRCCQILQWPSRDFENLPI